MSTSPVAAPTKRSETNRSSFLCNRFPILPVNAAIVNNEINNKIRKGSIEKLYKSTPPQKPNLCNDMRKYKKGSKN